MASLWTNTPQASLNYRCPVQMLADRNEMAELQRYLMQIEASLLS